MNIMAYIIPAAHLSSGEFDDATHGEQMKKDQHHLLDHAAATLGLSHCLAHS